jgi:hypothetical protein
MESCASQHPISPKSARLHERKPSLPIGSSQNQSGFANQAA